jgi:hypothetical protein
MAAAAPGHGQVALEAEPVALDPGSLEGPDPLGDPQGRGPAPLASRAPLGYAWRRRRHGQAWPGMTRKINELIK